ncbi:FliI/YscN family ATPase [Pseudoalteromonas sp.]|uniref:FliI/YscN family ATPase n=1 Tax=Pseudoalteromonas sp. TaxID=53249 RepID=UPI0023528CEA|nr:FliI/YscN family ATPase [Pseudoalteromonas sp.]
MLSRYAQSLESIETMQSYGSVLQSIGLVVEAEIPNVFVGEICEIFPKGRIQPYQCEVVGFKETRALLMPYEYIRGIAYGSKVKSLGRTAFAKVGESYIGRVIDAFGVPLDTKEHVIDGVEVPLHREPINPLDRREITTAFSTGIKSIDTFNTIGKGQRIGLFAGSGVGKSSLLSAICKNNHDESRINIIALVGERGREVEEFVRDTLGSEGLRNSIVIAATSEQPPLVRAQAVYYALAMAEYFSEQGKDVFLTIDSMTRFAMAMREVGLSIGEPPTLKGYTTSVFSAIPRLVERCGSFKKRGAITAVLTVLVENDDFNDPVVDTLRAILDGHVILSRTLAENHHFPAVDIMKSVSRLFSNLSTKEQQHAVQHARKVWNLYDSNKEFLELGMLEGDVDKLTKIKSDYESLCNFLQQDVGINVSASKALTALQNWSSERGTHDREQ